MQYIDKKLGMPSEIAKWINKNKPKKWNLSQDYRDGYDILCAQLRQEQYGLCCYCCRPLQSQVTIEHLKSRDKHTKLTFDYYNLLVSCKEPKQCDSAKGNQDIALTPLMTECDDELNINLAGELIANTDRAKEAITILNLNNETLCGKRRRMIDNIKFTFDTTKLVPPIAILDKATLTMMLDSLADTPEYYAFLYVLNKLG